MSACSGRKDQSSIIGFILKEPIHPLTLLQEVFILLS